MKTEMKDVVHIDDIEGPRGGTYWKLELSCGHTKRVYKPKFRPGDIFKPIRFAPYKCKCVICEMLAEIREEEKAKAQAL